MMFVLLNFIAGLAWVVSGPPALILDHLRRFDLKLGDAVFFTLCGIALGPFAWVIWWIDGNDYGAGRVLLKKRH